MRRLFNLAVAGTLVAAATAQGAAPQATPAANTSAATGFALTATYDREGLPVPQWSFRIAPTGSVEYTSHHALPGIVDSPVRFQLSRTGTAKLGKWLADSHGLSPCETKTKGLARMGTKTLSYTAADGAPVECSYNYSDNKSLTLVSDYLSQVSSTIEDGVTIDRLHRFDRLGLDPVLIRLADAAKAGKAQELIAIRPSLEALVADDAVLERVRLRAAALLQLASQQ